MFNALINQNIASFRAAFLNSGGRLTTAPRREPVITMLVTALAADGSRCSDSGGAMIYQDHMSFFSFVAVALPAFIALRKMICRIYAIARNHCSGTRILETMQETVQGIHRQSALGRDAGAAR
jgi:hypothetical protein